MRVRAHVPRVGPAVRLLSGDAERTRSAILLRVASALEALAHVPAPHRRVEGAAARVPGRDGAAIGGWPGRMEAAALQYRTT